MTEIALSNWLTDLAHRIKAEHEAVSDALKESVRHAITAGELLIEAKQQLKHGQWLPWLKDHCAISERTAQLYMRCARNRDAIEANTQRVADLTLNEAAAMLALSSDIKKLFDFHKEVERLTDPEEIMQLCLDSGAAQVAGRIDYESGYTVEQRREWDAFILFMVRHVGWPARDADDHVCWIKRHDFNSPSEWMGEEGDEYRRTVRVGRMVVGDELKQSWKNLLAETKHLDRVAINQAIAQTDKVAEDNRRSAPARRHGRRR
jgi:hypothetical protein